MSAFKMNESYSKLSESEIVSRVLNGEKELYELLLRRNNQKLYRVIRSYIKDSNEIEDTMQDTYLKAYEKLSQFKGASEFSTWLIRIGINESLARVKAKGKMRAINDQVQEFETNSIKQMPIRNEPTPEQRMIQHEARRFIEGAIDGLPPRFKVVFVLREIEGMSINEISECLDLSNSNVKVRLHRAKAILKEKLYELSSYKEVFQFGFSKCDNIVERVMRKI